MGIMFQKFRIAAEKQSITLSLMALGVIGFVPSSFAADDYAEVEGLPQLDFTTYTQQIFWMLIVFALLYFVFARKTLPDISNVIQNRKNHIDADLDSAEKLTSEADQVQESYQQSLETSQEKASSEVQKVETDMKAKAEKAAQEFRERSDDALKKAEANILKAQNAAMEDMNAIAAEAASEAVAKIIGGKSDVDKARSIIEGLNGKAKAA